MGGSSGDATACGCSLALVVQAESEDAGDGAAISVVGRIVDELVVQGGVEIFMELMVVVDLDVFLGAVVEGAVAGKDADTAGGKVRLGGF